MRERQTGAIGETSDPATEVSYNGWAPSPGLTQNNAKYLAG